MEENMSDKEKRDYERERDDLLKLINKNVPEEIIKAIEITLSAQSELQPSQIKISHKGAFDAD